MQLYINKIAGRRSHLRGLEDSRKTEHHGPHCTGLYPSSLAYELSPHLALLDCLLCFSASDQLGALGLSFIRHSTNAPKTFTLLHLCRGLTSSEVSPHPPCLFLWHITCSPTHSWNIYKAHICYQVQSSVPDTRASTVNKAITASKELTV